MKHLVLTLILNLLSTMCFAGNSVGNAGDFTAMEYTWTASLAIKRLHAAKLTTEQRQYLEAIELSLRTVTVISKPSLEREGISVDGLNYPDEKLIEISQDGWSVLKKSTAGSRIGFVLHELLGVSGFNDTGYKISKGLVDQIRDEQFADVAFEEKLLNNLYGLSWGLHMASIYADLSQLKKDNTAGYCFGAGVIRGDLGVLTLMISRTPTMPNSEQTFAIVLEASQDIELNCQKRLSDLERLKTRVERARTAIHELMDSISPNLDK